MFLLALLSLATLAAADAPVPWSAKVTIMVDAGQSAAMAQDGQCATQRGAAFVPSSSSLLLPPPLPPSPPLPLPPPSGACAACRSLSWRARARPRGVAACGERICLVVVGVS